MTGKNDVHAIELRVYRKSDKTPLIVSFAGLFDDYKRLLSFYKEDYKAKPTAHFSGFTTVRVLRLKQKRFSQRRHAVASAVG